MSKCQNCEEVLDLVVDFSRGEYTCRYCGLVQDERMVDDSLERRNFAGGADHNRGAIKDAFISALSGTIIPTSNTKKRKSDIETSSIRKTHMKIANTSNLIDEHLKEYYSVLKDVSQLLPLEKRVFENAKEILYKYEHENKNQKRVLRIKEGAIAALHLSCAQLRIGRTLNSLYMELREVGYEVDENDIMQNRKQIIKSLPGIDVQTRTEDVIMYMCETLKLPQIIINIATIINERSQEHVQGKTPQTISAGSIVLACDILRFPYEREDLIVVANTTDNTLVKYCREVKSKVSVLVEPQTLENIKQLHKVTQ